MTSFAQAVPDLIILALIYFLILVPRWKRYGARAFFRRTLLFLWISAMIYVTLMPVFLDLPNLFRGEYTRYNFNPFVDLVNGYGSAQAEIFMNILLFVPLTYLIRKTYRTSLLKASLIGMCFSMCIELFQPLISTIRVCDITDMITNTIGAVLGSLLYTLIHSER
jgi:glycopeptide antibiotics resistance protein